MNKEKILEYVTKTPENTNRNVLNGMIESLLKENSGDGGDGGQTDNKKLERKEVNFYDYDGTVVASYSANDFLQLSEMPKNPTHEGLISQGWNWSYESAIDYVSKYGLLEVGQSYITDNGATKLVINIPKEVIKRDITLCFTQSVENGVSIDWGDGSDLETTTGNRISHTYKDSKKYIISLLPQDDCILQLGYEEYDEDSDSIDNYDIIKSDGIYPSHLKEIFIGKNVKVLSGISDSNTFLDALTIPLGVQRVDTFGQYSEALILPKTCTDILYYSGISSNIISFPEKVNSFQHDSLRSLKANIVTIPETDASFGQQSTYSIFQNSLVKKVIIPSSAGSVPYRCFYNCKYLINVIISEGVVSLDEGSFYNCSSLTRIELPSSCNSIGKSCFSGCYNLLEFYVKSPTPTYLGPNCFDGIPSTCVFYVPQESVETYKTTYGWLNYSDRIQPIPQ